MMDDVLSYSSSSTSQAQVFFPGVTRLLFLKTDVWAVQFRSEPTCTLFFLQFQFWNINKTSLLIQKKHLYYLIFPEMKTDFNLI